MKYASQQLSKLIFNAVEESIRIVLRMRGLKPGTMKWGDEKVVVECEL